jgi:hypothetical protein
MTVRGFISTCQRSWPSLIAILSSLFGIDYSAKESSWLNALRYSVLSLKSGSSHGMSLLQLTLCWSLVSGGSYLTEDERSGRLWLKMKETMLVYYAPLFTTIEGHHRESILSFNPTRLLLTFFFRAPKWQPSSSNNHIFNIISFITTSCITQQQQRCSSALLVSSVRVSTNQLTHTF